MSVHEVVLVDAIRRACGKRSLLTVAGVLCAGTAAAQIEEITVTAEFRAANVQDTPVAITAVNAEMLEARGQTNIQQVAAQAPNVTLTPAGQANGKAMVAFIRGIGQTDFNYAMEPGVGVYVDDVYYPNLTGSMVELIDVDRVEILRGPQGTLAGRNAIGGAVKLFSLEPSLTGENSGVAELTVGDFDRVDVRGAADLTFIEDKLAARVAGVARSRTGHVTLLDYRCTHPTSTVPTYSHGRLDTCELGKLGGESFVGGRVSLLWEPSERVRMKIIGDVVNDDSDSGAQTLLGVNDPIQLTNGWGEGTFIDVDGNLATTADRVYYSSQMVPYGPRRGDPVINDAYVNYATFLDPMPSQPTRPFSPVNVDPGNRFDQTGLSVAVDWDISDRSSLKAILAYQEYSDTWAQDTDASPFNNQLLTEGLEHEHHTVELRFNSSAFNDRLDYTLGAFYVDQNKAILTANVNLHYAQLNFIHGPDPTPSDSTAVFAHTAWHLTDNLNLAVGLRYTEDNKFYQYRRRNPDGTLPPPCTEPPTLPPSVLANPPNCALAGLDGASASFSSDRTDYRVALDYHVSDNLMVYGQVATGYKAGGINPRPFFLVQIEQFEPEELTSYEIGFKATPGDGRARLNGALFFNKYDSIQLNQTQCELPFPPFFGPPCLQPGNVGDADVNGAELELELHPTDRFSIDLSLAYLDFEYTRIDSTRVQNVTLDMVAPFTPEFTGSIGVQYEWPLPSGGNLTARVDAIYQDQMYADAVNADTNLIDSYTLTNARLAWRSADAAWEAALEVTNVADEVHFLNIFDQYASTAGEMAGGTGFPRMWSVSLRRSFDF